MIRVTTEIAREVVGCDTPMISAIASWEVLVRKRAVTHSTHRTPKPPYTPLNNLPRRERPRVRLLNDRS